MRRHAWAFVVVAALAACGSGGDDSSPATVPADAALPSTTAHTTTTTTVDDVEAAVEQAYYEQWDAFVEILSDPDPTNPLIDRYFTGRAREKLLDSVSTFASQGLVAVRPEDPHNFHPSLSEVQIVGDSSAVVIECTIDGIQQVIRETGEIVNDEVTRFSGRIDFLKIDGHWKVSEITRLSDEEVTCDFD